MDEYTVSPADAAALILMPTIANSGQGLDLKLEIEDPQYGTAYRVWVPRMTDADREEYRGYTGVHVSPVDIEHQEQPSDGGWRWVQGTQDDVDRALDLARAAGLL